MLVCVCNAIREEDVREAARRGVSDAESAYAWLGKQPNCGICLDHAEDVIFDEQNCAGRRSCPASRFAHQVEQELRAI